jgi:glycosyltransferase involved in cell wall biosynthesis
MRILFLSDNFPPEVNAPATRTYEHCKIWTQQGHDITVVTCFPNFPQGIVYPGYKNKLFQKEVIDGIRIIRVFTYITANEGFIKRTLDYISFSIAGFIAGLFIATDVIIATSPQFFTALGGRTLSFIKRKPWIMEVRDLWPESIKTVGAMNNNLFIKYFEWQELRCYKSASTIISVTNSFKKRIIERGIEPNKIHVFKNGANMALFKAMPKDKLILSELGLNKKTVIGYIGTHGMAHKLDFILRCAKEINDPDIIFLFIGHGAMKNELLKMKDDLNLDNVIFKDSVPKNEVAKYISVIDIALIPLKKSELFKTVIPSKIFEMAAMHKPILLGVDGESREIIEQYQAGVYFEPENKVDFTEKMHFIIENKEKFYSGCEKLANDCDRNKIGKDFIKLLENNYQRVN